MGTDHDARKRALFARTSDAVLIESLKILEAMTPDGWKTSLSTAQRVLRDMATRADSPAFAKAVRDLKAMIKTATIGELIMVRAWTITEVERRFPAADAAVQAAFEADEAAFLAWDGTGEYPDVDYVGVLVANIKL